ncbi:MAG TPA: urate oxidase [Candidatus Limnocylindrales bacterium]|nr:urate oxidase [Candidatus Limnocylindrales bacterium]
MSLQHEIRYGKADVKVYRTYAEPLTGITPIPESPFRGRDNALVAAEIEVVVHGTEFLDAYTRGDNRKVVATDTMKNFIHAASLRAPARTLEEWLHGVGTAFLATYPHMERLTMLGRDLPFPAAVVPAADGEGFDASDRLFSRDRCDHGTARLELARHGDGEVRITDHESGRAGLQLIKITGSAFADFARDEHTTLPERRDRPLYIWLTIGWRYGDASHAVLGDPPRYVASEQVADLAAAVFHEFVSLSIQHLVNEIGTRMLDRWPQLECVSFDAQNRLWDVGVEADDGRTKTYADPRPPYGHIGLVLRREG